MIILIFQIREDQIFSYFCIPITVSRFALSIFICVLYIYIYIWAAQTYDLTGSTNSRTIDKCWGTSTWSLGERKRWNTKEYWIFHYFVLTLLVSNVETVWIKHDIHCEKALVRKWLFKDEKLVLMSCKNEKMCFLLFFSSFPASLSNMNSADNRMARSIWPDSVISFITKIRV